jgi:hypothetical protein
MNLTQCQCHKKYNYYYLSYSHSSVSNESHIEGGIFSNIKTMKEQMDHHSEESIQRSNLSNHRNIYYICTFNKGLSIFANFLKYLAIEDRIKYR